MDDKNGLKPITESPVTGEHAAKKDYFMAIIGMRNVCWGFDYPPLLENINFWIEKGDRACLLGRNGVGKSTILKLLSGEISPASGEIWRSQGTTVSILEQDVPGKFGGTVFDVAAGGAGKTGEALVEYNRLSETNSFFDNPELTKKRERLYRLLDGENGWDLIARVKGILSRIGLEPGIKFSNLSAGMKRRALFARALVKNPDILLLDEPTNHLDINSIVLMEDYILKYVKTLLFVTHDRTLLRRISTRILELDRGALVSYECDYNTYLNRKQTAQAAEAKQKEVFEKKLSKEEAWIRQGIKARRTRNEGRVKALQKMRRDYHNQRKKIGSARLQFQEAERTGKLVIRAKNISYAYQKKKVIHNFSTLIMRGDKVGIIGPNGTGKTTLLNLLLKNLSPDSGSIRHGENLQVAYYDQLRFSLELKKTVAENIGEGSDFIVFNSQKRHVISYLKDFLFFPERSRTPVHVLSGGEKNRLMLAKLFTKPANVLVLDEPTNDLDTETLELLEELLFEFKGTILLVSHDRTLLNNVVTSTIVFEKNGQIIEYAGGYDDYLIQSRTAQSKKMSGQEKIEPQKNLKKPKPQTAQKLTFKEKFELEELPRKIESMEFEQKELFEIMSDPQFYINQKGKISRIKKRLDQIEFEIDTAYRRWEELENKTY